MGRGGVQTGGCLRAPGARNECPQARSRDRKPRIKVSAGPRSLQSSGEESVLPSSRPWWLLTILGVPWLAAASLRFRPLGGHVVFLPVCLHSVPSRGLQSPDLGRRPLQRDLVLTSYI